MLFGKKIVVVLPAYNAGKTIAQTISDIPGNLVDDYIIVDDASTDNTVEVVQSMKIGHLIRHDKNRGYGGNQKTCYDAALQMGADIVIMLHPDYQYTPKLIPAMANLIACDIYPVVFGSRILGKGALKGGMPPIDTEATRKSMAVFGMCLIRPPSLSMSRVWVCR